MKVPFAVIRACSRQDHRQQQQRWQPQERNKTSSSFLSLEKNSSQPNCAARERLWAYKKLGLLLLLLTRTLPPTRLCCRHFAGAAAGGEQAVHEGLSLAFTCPSWTKSYRESKQKREEEEEHRQSLSREGRAFFFFFLVPPFRSLSTSVFMPLHLQRGRVQISSFSSKVCPRGARWSRSGFSSAQKTRLNNE